MPALYISLEGKETRSVVCDPTRTRAEDYFVFAHVGRREGKKGKLALVRVDSDRNERVVLLAQDGNCHGRAPMQGRNIKMRKIESSKVAVAHCTYEGGLSIFKAAATADSVAMLTALFSSIGGRQSSGCQTARSVLTVPPGTQCSLPGVSRLGAKGVPRFRELSCAVVVQRCTCGGVLIFHNAHTARLHGNAPLRPLRAPGPSAGRHYGIGWRLESGLCMRLTVSSTMPAATQLRRPGTDLGAHHDTGGACWPLRTRWFRRRNSCADSRSNFESATRCARPRNALAKRRDAM